MAADEMHREVQEELQAQLRCGAAEAAQAAAPTPGVQRRPAPEPFTTLPMPSNLPASSLPEPVRLARAGGIFPALSAPPLLEPMLQQHPHVGLVPDAGAATVSLGNVFGLGTGVFDGLIAAEHKLIARGADGSCYALPGSMLEFCLPYDAMRQLLQQQGKVGDPRRPCCSCPLHVLPPTLMLQSSCRPTSLPLLQRRWCALLSAWAPSSWMPRSWRSGCLQGSCLGCWRGPRCSALLRPLCSALRRPLCSARLRPPCSC
jgi:hypothetical protein